MNGCRGGYCAPLGGARWGDWPRARFIILSMKVFTNALIDIAKTHIPKTSRFHKKCSKPWFDDECKALIRERNKAERFNKRYPNVNNKMRVKLTQAQCRQKFRRKKRQSFRKFTSSITTKVHSKKVWSMVQKLTGKKVPSYLHHLKDEQGNLITDPDDISNKLGNTFSNNSSSDNYTDDFLTHKENEEQTPIDFSTNNYHKYNKKFKLRDLKRSIKRAKNSAAGPDQVHYEILKNLPNETLQILLDLVNEYWESHSFPPSWREALVIALPKEDKDHHYANNYRPIALTSCICKTFERMVNERLIYYLDKNKILSKFQCGFRNDKSTLDQLVRLETYIRDAFVNGEHVVAVFCDLQKAYDTTWKYGILKDLYNKGLRGNLPIFIQNFLSNRTFAVLYGATISDHYTQEEGVPQGSILSTTLFNIKLNDIVKEVLPGVECSLYVDDFVLIFKSKSMRTIQRKLQRCINKVISWTSDNGFTINKTEGKTVGMHFCKRRSCEDPELFLGDTRIKFEKEHKFLGLVWDPKLSFRAHIKYLKKKCQSPLNLLKVLSHTDWGADTKTLLKLYRALVRSKLDYGCIVYRNAAYEDLKPLDVIHNQGIRLSLGAFKSSPVESMYVEAHELPLNERRIELSMKYGLKIKGNPKNPAYSTVFDLQHLDKYTSLPAQRKKSLAVDLDCYFEDAGIDISKIKPNFIPDSPACYSKPIDVCFSLAEYPKSTTPDAIYIAKFNEIKATQYSDFTPFFTDGSKIDETTSFGVYSEYGVSSSRISDNSSVFTAETEGIKRALNFILAFPTYEGKYVIFCDSKSVLESITNFNTRNVLIKETTDLIQRIIRAHKTIAFCWVPGHVGIQGNENADQAAKRALRRAEPPQYRLPYSDYFPGVKSYVKQKWQQRWNSADANRPNKLYTIQPDIKPFHVEGLTRKEESVVHRLRIGHTRLTHGYLMEQRGPIKIPPTCNLCNNPDEPLTVNHFLINCPALGYIRGRYYRVPDIRYLFENVPLKQILTFLREAGLFKHI